MVDRFYLFENLAKYSENICLIWRESLNKESYYRYEEVIQVARVIISYLDEFEVGKFSKILVNLEHTPVALPVLLSVLNRSCCFCPVYIKNNKEINENLERYQTNCFISDKPLNATYTSLKTVSAFQKNIYIYLFKNKPAINKDHEKNFCYAIQTSGTTGKPKIVSVPWSCILPNVCSLSEILSVTSKDVIFVSSAVTFDPFMVDVFLAIKNGSSCLLIPPAIRLVPNVLAPMAFRKNRTDATICQMTPSQFKRFDSKALSDFVFHVDTSLRCLILGGEPFPRADEYQNWAIWSTAIKTRLFNIYGITEVSCWASIEEVFKETAKVSIGRLLDSETLFEVREKNEVTTTENRIGELFIGSATRKCIIDSENVELLLSQKSLFRSTGDLVEKQGDKIYYRSRTNAVVKRFGCRVNLKIVEAKICDICEDIDKVCCIFNTEDSMLLAFVKLNENKNTDIRISSTTLVQNLSSVERPDDIMILSQFPLTCHGKISKSKLLKHYQLVRRKENLESKGQANVIDLLTRRVDEMLGISIDCGRQTDENSLKRRKVGWSKLSFIECGGTSFMAIRLVAELEDLMCKSLPTVLIKLLDASCPLQSVFLELEALNLSRNELLSLPTSPVYQNRYSLTLLWKNDFEKCVDASPTIILLDDYSIAAVGSHSHKLACIDINTGQEISTIQFPDRIEGAVSFVENYGIVGCYDGFLYKFRLETGETVKRFNSNGMIKCKPLIAKGNIIFGNYAMNKNVYCVNCETFNELWSIKFGQKSCFASPLLADSDSIIICTLEGFIGCLTIETGCILWQLILGSPIFSTPIKLSTSRLAVAEVSGKVHWIRNATKINSFTCNGSIFSSLIKLNENEIIFGCHDCCLYCLEYNEEINIFQLKWKITMESQIYSTPSLLQFRESELITCCTTTGWLHIIERRNQNIQGSIKLNGEIFSSPAVSGTKIIIGCRDNFLYCIDIREEFI